MKAIHTTGAVGSSGSGRLQGVVNRRELRVGVQELGVLLLTGLGKRQPEGYDQNELCAGYPE